MISKKAGLIVLMYARIEDVEGRGGFVDLVDCRLLVMIINAVLAWEHSLLLVRANG